jgi:hypothetical protein
MGCRRDGNRVRRVVGGDFAADITGHFDENCCAARGGTTHSARICAGDGNASNHDCSAGAAIRGARNAAAIIDAADAAGPHIAANCADRATDHTAHESDGAGRRPAPRTGSRFSSGAST